MKKLTLGLTKRQIKLRRETKRDIEKLKAISTRISRLVKKMNEEEESYAI